MCRVQTVMFWLCLSLTLCSLTQGEVRECTVSSNRVLTTFSGETVTLTLPCKYRMADFTCGDYRVKVTPGNGVMTSDSSLTPVTVHVNVKNKVTKEQAELRIARKKLAEGWKNVESSSAGLDYVGYDETLQRAALRKDSVFDVEFTEDGDVTVRCHTDNFSSKPGPDSLCGTGTGSPIETAATSRGLTKESLINWAILLNDKVTQSKTCVDMAAMFQSCDDTDTELRQCEVIIDVTTSQWQCLATSDTPLADYYSDCLTAVCTQDDSLLAGLNTFISENCDGVDLIGQESSGAEGEEVEEGPCTSENWSWQACSSDSDCPDVAHSVCVLNNHCSCVAGYFYSESSGCCLEECNEFSDKTGEVTGYTVTPGLLNATRGRLAEIGFEDPTAFASACLQPCAAHPYCVTVSRVNKGSLRCVLWSITPLDTHGVQFDPHDKDSILWQKKCQ